VETTHENTNTTTIDKRTCGIVGDFDFTVGTQRQSNENRQRQNHRDMFAARSLVRRTNLTRAIVSLPSSSSSSSSSLFSYFASLSSLTSKPSSPLNRVQPVRCFAKPAAPSSGGAGGDAKKKAQREANQQGAGKVGSTVFTLRGVDKYFHGEPLFTDVNLGAFEGAKIGIVGVNGAGKSCLLKIVAGVDEGTLGACVCVCVCVCVCELAVVMHVRVLL
jgi:ABC-type multidrug transport system fused ATPase/permease subunit